MLALSLNGAIALANSLELENTATYLQALNHTSASVPSWVPSTGRILFSAGAETLSMDDPSESDYFSKKRLKGQVAISFSPFYPVGIGFIMGDIASQQEQNIMQLASYLQWTIFEKFRLPTFSLRGQYSKLFSKDLGVDFKTYTMQGQVSWGYRLISAFMGASIQYDILKNHYAAPIESDSTSLESQFSNSLNFGLHVQLVPGKVSFVTEKETSKHSNKTSGKIIFEF